MPFVTVRFERQTQGQAHWNAGTNKDALTLCAGAGFAASDLFNQGISYTYDDVIFHPGHIDFGADEVRRR